jgi:hypothetical protein
MNAHENNLYAYQLRNTSWLQNRDTNMSPHCRNSTDKQFNRKTELLLQTGMYPAYSILLTPA